MTELVVWLVFAAVWIPGWLLTARRLARNILEEEARAEATRRHHYLNPYPNLQRVMEQDDRPLVSEHDIRDARASSLAFMFAVWPLFWALRGVRALAPKLTGDLTPPTELARRERVELEQARKTIAEYDAARERELLHVSEEKRAAVIAEEIVTRVRQEQQRTTRIGKQNRRSGREDRS